MGKDILGKALYDFYKKEFKAPLLLHNSYGKPETQPVRVFFQTARYMQDLDLYALSLCKGKVLDIGAGTGRHALELQQRKVDVTAMDNSPACIKLMQERGLNQVIHDSIFKFEGTKFDTLLLMMNGIGLCETLDGLDALFDRFKLLMKPDSQALFDSSDISYLYLDNPFPDDKYFGEIDYRYEYDGEMGEWFKWVYIDKDTLQFKSERAGFNCQIIYQDSGDQYLARLTLRDQAENPL